MFTHCAGKIGNRERNRALDFDGFCWMEGCNNQPKVSRNDGISFREDGVQGNVALFVPPDFGAKINITKFVMGIGGRQSTTARNNQPN
jgi:hypothetical protein